MYWVLNLLVRSPWTQPHGWIALVEESSDQIGKGGRDVLGFDEEDGDLNRVLMNTMLIKYGFVFLIPIS